MYLCFKLIAGTAKVTAIILFVSHIIYANYLIKEFVQPDIVFESHNQCTNIITHL